MVRLFRNTGLILGLCLGLAACQTDGGGVTVNQAPNIAPGNPEDTRTAKALFGAMPTGSSQPPNAVGFYSRGCQAGAQQLAESGPTWQAMRLSRNRNWGQPILIDYIQQLSAFAATQPGWEGLYVGDMSQPRGGPMLTGHRSHQSGLDVDIWMLPPDRLNLTRTERENLSSIRTDRNSGTAVNGSWSQEHMNILRRAASDPRVDRIFVFAAAKVAMCDAETGDRSWLRQIRPWYGHNYHFHVRLRCPAGAPYCEPQNPIPAGDGCEDARQWVRDVLDPPPPDPNAPAPRPRSELTMANLPAYCAQVLVSD